MPDFEVLDARIASALFFCFTPEPHIAFCPIYVHPLFLVFEPHIQKWVIFVTLLDSNLRPSAEKRSNLALRQLNFPNVKNDAGQKQCSPCFLTRHTAYCPLLDLRPAFLLNIAGLWPAMFNRKGG